VRHDEREQSGVVVHELQTEVHFQEQVHEVASGPREQHGGHGRGQDMCVQDDACRESVHFVLCAHKHAEHEHDSEHTSTHQKAVVHLDARGEVVHADAECVLLLHCGTELRPPHKHELRPGARKISRG